MTRTVAPSLCICDLDGQTVLRYVENIPTPLSIEEKTVGLDVRKHYAMHTGMVRVNVLDLQSFEYARDIKDEDVEKIVANMLVRVNKRSLCIHLAAREDFRRHTPDRHA